MLDFGALPPEINSARMYAGQGPGSMLAAAASWQSLAAELNSAAANYRSVVSGLTSGPWTGPTSTTMAAAVTPYVSWLAATAAQAEHAAAQLSAAAGAYETAFAATVPPSVIAANRSLLAMLVATNFLGQNSPAIAATEAHYTEMWAQDAAAMYGYANSAAAASTVTPFTEPPQITNPDGLANQAAAVAQAAGTAVGTHAQTVMSAGPQLVSAMPHALESLATSSSGSGSSHPTSALSMLNMLTMPLRMATMPMSMLMRMFMMGGMGGTNTAARAVGSTAGALSSALRVEFGSGTLGQINLSGLGSSAPVISAGMGRAASIGALSVPSTWSGMAPSISPVATAMPATGTPAIPALQVSAESGMPSMMPIANLAGRGVPAAPPRFELRSSVVPRSPAGG